MTQIVRYTHPTQAQTDAVLAQAREMRSAFVASFFQKLGTKLRGAFVGGKVHATA